MKKKDNQVPLILISIAMASVIIGLLIFLQVILHQDQPAEKTFLTINVSDSLTTFGALTKIEMIHNSTGKIKVILSSTNDTVFCEFPIEIMGEEHFYFKDCVFIEKSNHTRQIKYR